MPIRTLEKSRWHDSISCDSKPDWGEWFNIPPNHSSLHRYTVCSRLGPGQFVELPDGELDIIITLITPYLRVAELTVPFRQ